MERSDMIILALGLSMALALLGSSSWRRSAQANTRNESRAPIYLLEEIRDVSMPSPYNLSLEEVEGGAMVTWMANGSALLASGGDIHRFRLASWESSDNESGRPKNTLARLPVTGDDSYCVLISDENLNDMVGLAVYSEVILKDQGIMRVSNMSRLAFMSNNTKGGD